MKFKVGDEVIPSLTGRYPDQRRFGIGRITKVVGRYVEVEYGKMIAKYCYDESDLEFVEVKNWKKFME